MQRSAVRPVPIVVSKVVALFVSLAVLLAGCGRVACGRIDATCEVSVRDAHGRPVTGATVVWQDRGDDRFWRAPKVVKICVTDAGGSCAGNVSYPFSRAQYEWLPDAGRPQYRIVAFAPDRQTGHAALDSLSRPQVSGASPVVTAIVVR